MSNKEKKLGKRKVREGGQDKSVEEREIIER
jgi:hypothetical protein